MLKFIGTGSAFNTALGNNSAYYKFDDEMLLIDCGSNIFERIKERNLLDGVNHIHVLVTHTHADHVGSLGDLIFYTYYSHGEFKKAKVTVYSLKGVKVKKFLKKNGVVDGVEYNFKELKDGYYHSIGRNIFISLSPTKHVENLKCCKAEIEIGDTSVFYSGDTCEITDFIASLINCGGRYNGFDIAYIDTCSQDYEGNVHLSLKKLTEAIEPEYRHKVWCMHLDEKFDADYAKSLGFNVAEVDFNE